MATTPATTSTNPLTVYISGSSEGKNVDEGEGEGKSEGEGEGESEGEGEGESEGESEGEGEGEGESEGEGEERTVVVGRVGLEEGQLSAQCM